MSNCIMSAPLRMLPVTVAFLIATNVSAQEPVTIPLSGSLDFLEVKDCKLYTSHRFDDGNAVEWKGEGMHTGLQAFNFVLHNSKEIPKKFDTPENPTFYFVIKDTAGDTIGEATNDITSVFRKLHYVSRLSISMNATRPVTRGGQYKVCGGISPFEYQNSVPETVITDPTANKEVKYYNVFGQPVTNTYKGVVITSDGKKLLLR